MFDTTNVAYKNLVNASCPNTNLPPFCQFFIDIKLSHNLSVEELSQLLGINQNQSSEIERGKIWGNVTPSMITKLDNIFNLKKGCARNYLKQSCLVK